MSHIRNNKNILITGSYGMGNTGDEAILASMLSQLHAKLPEAVFKVVAGDTKSVREQFGVETVSWDNWLDIITAVKQSDLIIQGGGGLFFDYGGVNFESLLQNAAPDLAHFGSYSLLAKLYNKPFIIYACGVGPLFTEEGREITRMAFSLTDRASVRDEESKAVLESIGISSGSVQVTADPAFCLPVTGIEHIKAILDQHHIKSGRPLIAVTPRPWDFEISQEDWETRLANELAVFANELQAQILLIPFHQGYDDSTAKRIQEKLTGCEVSMLEGHYTVSELAGIIGQSDLLVGMRLHSILFAILTGTPAVALVYDPKVRNLARRVGHEDICLNLNELYNLKSTMTHVWNRRLELRMDFLRAADELKTLAIKNTEHVFELLQRDLPDQTASDFTSNRILAHIIEGRLKQINTNNETNQALEKKVLALKAELDGIYSSRAWRVVNLYRKLRSFI